MRELGQELMLTRVMGTVSRLWGVNDRENMMWHVQGWSNLHDVLQTVGGGEGSCLMMMRVNNEMSGRTV